MGIVNVTPDSFSDGGSYFDTSAAVRHARQLIAQGADLLDIGGESTRPYATPVSRADELRRVMPVIEQLRGETTLPMSIDTSKAAVAREALACGVEVINDVTGLTGDPDMVPLAAETRCGVCAMHMQGTPATMQDHPHYRDVVADIARYLGQRRDALLAAGIDPQRICLDPGIGFGKTHQHNLTLLRQADRFLLLGCPLLVGPSRKGFLAHVLGDKQADRTAATVGVCLALAARGVQVLRVHDVGPVRQALRLFAATGGLDAAAPAADRHA
ncbi:MAG: dihydropteroate synthase [Pirellulaceae bacterium]|jgi:dihydropteroate synthase|nr:dihydropteroate synthase [Pirellulaceae bacterium]